MIKSILGPGSPTLPRNDRRKSASEIFRSPLGSKPMNNRRSPLQLNHRSTFISKALDMTALKQQIKYSSRQKQILNKMNERDKKIRNKQKQYLSRWNRKSYQRSVGPRAWSEWFL